LQKEIALNAIKPQAGSPPHSITKALQLQEENSVSVATRLISPLTICTAKRRQAAERAIAPHAGCQQHLTITAITDLTVITEQVAKHAIPIQTITKNIPVITAMNTRSPILQTSIVKRESTITRTA